MFRCPVCNYENELYDSIIEARGDTLRVNCQSESCGQLLKIYLDRSTTISHVERAEREQSGGER